MVSLNELRFNHSISSLTMNLYQCNALLCCNKLSLCTDVHFLRAGFWSCGVYAYLVSTCLLRKASISVSEKLHIYPPPPPTQLQSTDKKLGFILSLGRSRCAVAQTLTLIQKPFTLSNNEYIFTIKKKSLTHRATCIHKMPCLRKIHHLVIFLLPFKAILNNDNRVLLSLISRKGRIST